MAYLSFHWKAIIIIRKVEACYVVYKNKAIRIIGYREKDEIESILNGLRPWKLTTLKHHGLKLSRPVLCDDAANIRTLPHSSKFFYVKITYFYKKVLR